ncbi:MAG: hypothetical protein ABI821_07235 [Pseudomonadota bacterium]
MAALVGVVVLAHLVAKPQSQDLAALTQELAQIRARPFKRPLNVRYLTHEEAFADILAQLAAKEPLSAHYGKIVRMLGLYRGPEIADFIAPGKN